VVSSDGYGFDGFGVVALDFYEDLEDDNTKAFWTAHKQVYDREVRAPMLALLERLAPEFGTGKAYRPYRDVRFAADKTPYKTHQGGFVARGDITGFYVEVNAAGVRVAAGCYQMSGPTLNRYRDGVDDDRLGTELQAVVDGLRAAGYEIGGDRMRTRPRGVAADHPRLELMRHRGLTAGVSYGSPPWVHTAELADRVAADWRSMAPLVDWMADHVSGTDSESLPA
jgi:uncharacterized protein (TIGR02453 family)